MTENPGFLITILAFVLVLGPLVFVHEMGHYLVGRWFGVKADTFSIGFGKEIAGWTDKRGTRWKVGALPLGGYVQFAGDMDPSSSQSQAWLELPAEERNRTFQSKALYQRALIVFAGPAINFIFAILILGGFAAINGEVVQPPVAQAIQPGSAAAKAGLQGGDIIRSVDGESIGDFNDLRQRVVLRPDETITVTYARGGEVRATKVRIGTRIERDRFGNEFRLGQLGIAPGGFTTRPVPLYEAPLAGVRETGNILRFMGDSISQIVTGRRSVKELGGPLTIARVSGEQFVAGPQQFIFFIALISINLGFINLLPVPMLDGGHLMFYAAEAVRRKPASPRVMEWAFRGGLAVVLALMLLVTANDLVSFGLFR